MRSVVSNTTPLISFLKRSRLDILEQLYGQILIPEAVYKEVEAGKHKAYYQDLSKINWIKVEQIGNDQALNYFLDLDTGEAETIVLATELQADLVLIDEKLGRFHAMYANLKVTGTIGILLKAKQQGVVHEIKPMLNELKKKDVWISEHLKKKILLQAGEN